MVVLHAKRPSPWQPGRRERAALIGGCHRLDVFSQQLVLFCRREGKGQAGPGRARTPGQDTGSGRRRYLGSGSR